MVVTRFEQCVTFSRKVSSWTRTRREEVEHLTFIKTQLRNISYSCEGNFKRNSVHRKSGSQRVKTVTYKRNVCTRSITSASRTPRAQPSFESRGATRKIFDLLSPRRIAYQRVHRYPRSGFGITLCFVSNDNPRNRLAACSRQRAGWRKGREEGRKGGEAKEPAGEAGGQDRREKTEETSWKERGMAPSRPY